MEKLVSDNFDVLVNFENHLMHMNEKDVDRSSVKKILLGHFEEVIKKVFWNFLRLGLPLPLLQFKLHNVCFILNCTNLQTMIFNTCWQI